MSGSSFLPTCLSHKRDGRKQAPVVVPEQISLPCLGRLSGLMRETMLEPRLLWNCNKEVQRNMGLCFLAAVPSLAQIYQYSVVWQVQDSLLAVLLSVGSQILGWGVRWLFVFLRRGRGSLIPCLSWTRVTDALILLRSCLMCSTHRCTPSILPTLLV